MYADQIEAQANSHRSVKDRLEGNSAAGPGRRQPIFAKRQREDDDKWAHDLYEDNEPLVSSRKVGSRDLRLKLQRKSIDQPSQSVREPGGGRDLREKLTGALYSRPVENKPPAVRPKPAIESSKPPRKSVISQAPAQEVKVSSSVSKKKVQEKVNSVESFLQSLGLDKYSITFLAEEVDMAALVHMSDEDLKAMGIPMGPRKKILLELESKREA
ncbi:uncharacterized protein LOC121762226 [Salvia splendens]|uniref:uncharacterized protein LOC121762226 n=1 Tax=Salvia splendens TaxID=180675 RepID=UPI001C266B31|nr:uncharacterized protein LOC121762226 [Salvia splendens]